MRGVILAAGRGSRMKEKTVDKPKCLNEILGKTLLNWQLESLRIASVKNVTVVRGYLSEMIKGDFKTVDNIRWSETNMVSSLFCVDSSNEETLISYSDITFKHEHIELLKEAEGDIVISADKLWEKLWRLRFKNPLEDAETFKANRFNELLEIGKKTNDLNNIEAQYMGLIKLTPSGWDSLKNVFDSFTMSKKDKMDMTTMLSEMINRGYKINVVFVNGGWCEADSFSDILAYESVLFNNSNWSHDWR